MEMQQMTPSSKIAIVTDHWLATAYASAAAAIFMTSSLVSTGLVFIGHLLDDENVPHSMIASRQKPQNISHHALSTTAKAAANHTNAITRRGNPA